MLKRRAETDPVGVGSQGHTPQAYRQGLIWGGLGVLAFSLSLPATRLAVSGLDGTVVRLGRAVVAGLLAAALLALRREPLPPRRFWLPLAVVACGVVVGFPLFSSLALIVLPASHGAVITGLLPAATAALAVVRTHERPPLYFWLASALGLLAVLVFALVEGAGRPQLADGLILIAVLLGALGYAEGGRLARSLGSWQVICWALVFSLPVLAPLVALRIAHTGLSAGAGAWAGFAYVSLFSMFLGFFAWYRGLASGGVARISQLQLAQPVLTLIWSALLLHERVTAAFVLAASAVLLSVLLTQRAGRSP